MTLMLLTPLKTTNIFLIINMQVANNDGIFYQHVLLAAKTPKALLRGFFNAILPSLCKFSYYELL